MTEEEDRRAREHGRRARAAAVSVTGSGPAGGYDGRLIREAPPALDEIDDIWAQPEWWPRSGRHRVFLAEAVKRLGHLKQGVEPLNAATRPALVDELFQAGADGALAFFCIREGDGERSIPAGHWLTASQAEARRCVHDEGRHAGWIYVDGHQLDELLDRTSPPEILIPAIPRRVQISDLTTAMMSLIVSSIKSTSPSAIAKELVKTVEGSQASLDSQRVSAVRSLMAQNGWKQSDLERVSKQ